MDLLPYVERMGAAAGVIFFALYLREAFKRDAMTTKLIELLPLVVGAVRDAKALVDTRVEVERARADAAAARKDK